MKFLILVVSLLAACFPVAASAQPLPGGTIIVTNIHLEGNKIYITGDGYTNPHGCQNTQSFLLSPPPELSDRYLTMAMTALATGMPLSIWVWDCASGDWGMTVDTAYAIQMKKSL